MQPNVAISMGTPIVGFSPSGLNPPDGSGCVPVSEINALSGVSQLLWNTPPTAEATLRGPVVAAGYHWNAETAQPGRAATALTAAVLSETARNAHSRATKTPRKNVARTNVITWVVPSSAHATVTPMTSRAHRR